MRRWWWEAGEPIPLKILEIVTKIHIWLAEFKSGWIECNHRNKSGWVFQLPAKDTSPRWTLWNSDIRSLTWRMLVWSYLDNIGSLCSFSSGTISPLFVCCCSVSAADSRSTLTLARSQKSPAWRQNPTRCHIFLVFRLLSSIVVCGGCPTTTSSWRCQIFLKFRSALWVRRRRWPALKKLWYWNTKEWIPESVNSLLNCSKDFQESRTRNDSK